MSTPASGRGAPGPGGDGLDGSRPIADVGERGLIERIRRRFGAASPILPVGIGDDGAVLEPDRGSLQVLTTDAVVEGVHFDRRFSTLRDVGYKALAVNLSDNAAMGGLPRVALLSLILPDSLALADFDLLLDGFAESAAESRVLLAGGNLTRSPGPLIVDVSLVGSVKRRKVLTRGGGRPGDALFVTGRPGMAAAGLGWLRTRAADRPEDPADPELAECVRRYRRPEPRTRFGALLGRTQAARACMDLSDGLADAITQVAAASGTGAVLDASALPIHPGASRWFESQGRDPVLASVAGGDDYELLLAVSPRRGGRLRAAIREARGLTVTRIGELTAERDVVLRRDGRTQPLPPGFVHF